jgi:hypothetical protein
MLALASQERFEELQASTSDATEADSSRSDEHADDRMPETSSTALREIERLLDIAARAYYRPIRPARPIEASCQQHRPAKSNFQLPPPSKYPRKK